MSVKHLEGKTLQQLEYDLLAPSPALKNDLAKIDGDILFLGIGGKMGPSMAKLAKRACLEMNDHRRIIGASRFSNPELKTDLEKDGIETISVDLLKEDDLRRLPSVKNIIYLAGNKFGTTGKEPFTWAMNAYLPGRVAEQFKHSRIVAFSTGNVYPFLPITQGAPSEEVTPNPVGEYGQSCFGRERIFQYFSEKNQTPTLIYRLNYAVDFRYGVLLEIAKSVLQEKPIDVTAGIVNVIWQGDANEIAIRSFLHTSSPAKILNVTGPETLSVRWIAQQFGQRFDKIPHFLGEEASNALMNNASEAHRLFGYPKTTIQEMLDITATWLLAGGETWNKETHFQERAGKF